VVLSPPRVRLLLVSSTLFASSTALRGLPLFLGRAFMFTDAVVVTTLVAQKIIKFKMVILLYSQGDYRVTTVKKCNDELFFLKNICKWNIVLIIS
jgi:hypothetical protein